MNTPIEGLGTRSRNKNDDADDYSVRRSYHTGTESPSTPQPQEQNIVLCSVCKKPIQGLTIVCQDCNHVFHIHHYIEWFKVNEECPVIGCTHFCNHSQTTDQLLQRL